MKFLHLNFLPLSTDAGLLVLRLWFGGAILFLHGWGKLTGVSSMSGGFPDPLGIGPTPSLVGAIIGEALGGALIALGLFTRLAALIGAFTMFVAFWMIHGHVLSGKNSGEMAFLYLGAFLVLLVAGGGKFSLDAKMGAKG